MTEHRPTGRQWEFLIYALLLAAVAGGRATNPQPPEWASMPIEREDNPLSQFAATTSAQLAGVISNETGSGALVFSEPKIEPDYVRFWDDTEGRVMCLDITLPSAKAWATRIQCGGLR